MSGASLYDFNDRDLMHRLSQEGSAEGLTARELAEAIGLTGETAAQAIGVRASWMRHFGFFDYDPKRKLWSLSPSGDRIVESHVAAATMTRLEAVPEEAMVEVMAHVTARYQRADAVTANLLRREFLFGTKRR